MLYETTNLSTTRRYRNVELRIAAVGGKQRISGLAVPYNQLSDDLGGFRELFLPGAFADSISSDVFADIEHDAGRRVARTKNGTLTLSENRSGLWASIAVPETSKGADLLADVRSGLIDGMSIAFLDARGKFTGTGSNMIRTISKATLRAVALTSTPAYRQTIGTLTTGGGGGRSEPTPVLDQWHTPPAVAVSLANAALALME